MNWTGFFFVTNAVFFVLGAIGATVACDVSISNREALDCEPWIEATLERPMSPLDDEGASRLAGDLERAGWQNISVEREGARLLVTASCNA